MFKCFAMVCWRFGVVAASFLREIHSKIVIKKKNCSFMLCVNLLEPSDSESEKIFQVGFPLL